MQFKPSILQHSPATKIRSPKKSSVVTGIEIQSANHVSETFLAYKSHCTIVPLYWTEMSDWNNDDVPNSMITFSFFLIPSQSDRNLADNSLLIRNTFGPVLGKKTLLSYQNSSGRGSGRDRGGLFCTTWNRSVLPTIRGGYKTCIGVERGVRGGYRGPKCCILYTVR